MDNRVAQFRDWLSKPGYRYLCCASVITPDVAEALIGTYLVHVLSLPVNKQGQPPKTNTLSHHATAAEAFLKFVMTVPFSMYHESGGGQVLTAFIGDKVCIRQKWQNPREKREAYTFPMFKAFRRQVK
jgi:hypothetical protein